MVQHHRGVWIVKRKILALCQKEKTTLDENERRVLC